MHLSVDDFMRKFASIPEDEPIYKILKSRTINLAKIKDKEERRYWRELKMANQIPQDYMPIVERKNGKLDLGEII